MSSKELVNLAGILYNHQSLNRTFNSLSSSFNKTFAKTDHFKLGKALISLLSNDLLTDDVSKSLAIFFLWDIYKSEPLENHPFIPFIIGTLKSDNDPKQLDFRPSFKSFMHTIMKSPRHTTELYSMTLTNALTSDAEKAWSHPSSRSLTYQTPLNCDWSKYEPYLYNRSQKLPKIDTCGISCVIPDEDILSQICENRLTSAQQQKSCLESLLTNESLLTASLQTLRPEFLRLAPPLLSCPQAAAPPSEGGGGGGLASCSPDSPELWAEELAWLCPSTVEHSFHWDASMGQSDAAEELLSLISLALTSSLTNDQKQALIKAIEEDPGSLSRIGLTADTFPELVNRNPIAAAEMLRVLPPSAELDLLLEILSEMDVNVHSLEVINRVASKISLPQEYLRKCVTNCMRGCQNAPDNTVQLRLARIVCLVIQTWVRGNKIDITGSDILVEIQSFCLEFNKVREATQLYRLTKTLESNTLEASQSTSR